jgi:DNA-binding NtrC family response regulator
VGIKGIKILVVDDDEIIREVVSSLLIGEGYSVRAAKDGLDAVKLLKTEEVHLVITDLRMPGADGIEVLKESLKLDADRAVIILTAYGTIDTALKAIREGAYDYMTKPFKMEEMVIRVHNACERTRMVLKIKTLTKILREIMADAVFLKSSDTYRSRIGDWIENVEQMKNLEILEQAEAALIKERLIGEW